MPKQLLERPDNSRCCRALAERINLTPADYLRRLSDAQQRLKLVEASLTLSYHLLAPGLQKLWRTLAVFPATVAADGVTVDLG